MAAFWTEAHMRCDECGRTLSMPDADVNEPPPLPAPWRRVNVVGWAGDFHCCSDRCEEGLRERYERS